jgi:hypothetical protein
MHFSDNYDFDSYSRRMDEGQNHKVLEIFSATKLSPHTATVLLAVLMLLLVFGTQMRTPGGRRRFA